MQNLKNVQKLNKDVPPWAVKMLRSSGVPVALAGAYQGGSKTRRQTSSWLPRIGDADADSLSDITSLRNRSSDALRNNPIAAGAINTNCVHVIGAGLRLQSRIDRKFLGIEEEKANELQEDIERKFNAWAESQDSDIARTNNIYDNQTLSFRSRFEKGDSFVLLTHEERKTSPFSLALQLIESERISNLNNARDTKNLVAGIEKADNGAPVAYWVRSTHPGSDIGMSEKKWDRIPAFTESGRRNILHLYRQLRPGQTRGIPYLAPVMEVLHQLGRYTEAEVMNAVISSYFTVFIKTPSGNVGFSPFEPTAESGGKKSDKDYKLAMGAFIELAKEEEVVFADPKRPNTNFDQFVQAICSQIGAALGLPIELLTMRFTKSYSASRAAMLMVWKMFITERAFEVNHYNMPIYDAWMEEAVLRSIIILPGFDDPMVRRAYLRSFWIGPTQGQIDPLREINAAEKRVNMTVSTIREEAIALTGSDWDQKTDQIMRERRFLKEIGSVKAEQEANNDGLEDVDIDDTNESVDGREENNENE